MSIEIKEKIHLTFFFIIFVVFVFSLIKNRTEISGHEKMIFMESDVNEILKNGGNVIARKPRSQRDSATYFLTFKDEGWSAALLQNNINTLLLLGWEKRPNNIFCKKGVKLEIKEGQSMHQGQGTNTIDLFYSARTIKECQ
ncbi:hypothetical protein IGS59_24870 [Janthinobacterium sp. GW460P]|uniref:hypothetical protein n=1 Tax=unclassified Janthinobacterium TaxID=2610881 RepID=UPI00111C59EA|nr:MULTISPECIES: hypothetical protein [unclassified Janthinobacterium]MCC7705478.1 hypothetical protein [Janthinobacterium sp. GW460P]MCC7711074.1 hypothetical protein [Janthinobacterium sp. GW460W]